MDSVTRDEIGKCIDDAIDKVMGEDVEHTAHLTLNKKQLDKRVKKHEVSITVTLEEFKPEDKDGYHFRRELADTLINELDRAGYKIVKVAQLVEELAKDLEQAGYVKVTP